MNQTNLEKDLNFCQTELEADLEKVETINKSPSANPPQVFPSFSLAVGSFSSPASYFLFSSLFFGFPVVEMAEGDAASFKMHGFLNPVYTRTCTGSIFCLESFGAWHLP